MREGGLQFLQAPIQAARLITVGGVENKFTSLYFGLVTQTNSVLQVFPSKHGLPLSSYEFVLSDLTDKTFLI
jgi:hypothetical protein